MKMWMQRMQAKEEKFDMTIKEIAQLAQVSSAAVSRYLNGGYVSEEKKERIREAIEKTGYHPSAQARILRTKKCQADRCCSTKAQFRVHCAGDGRDWRSTGGKAVSDVAYCHEQPVGKTSWNICGCLKIIR